MASVIPGKLTVAELRKAAEYLSAIGLHHAAGVLIRHAELLERYEADRQFGQPHHGHTDDDA